jgi:guanylate kinase
VGSATNNVPHSSSPSPDLTPLRIVISGPGGVGKGTIVAGLMAADDQLWLSQSWSTRSPRPGEASDAYNFVTTERFDAHVEAAGFLEWVEFLEYRQGTPVPDAPPGSDVVFEIDVYGGIAIAERYAAAMLLFVDTPSRDEQRRRLVGRGDPPEKVDARIERGDLERSLAADAGYQMLINDDLETTVAEIRGLINAARGGRGSSGE